MKSRRPPAHNKDAFCCCCVSADLELNFENETNLEKCLGFYVVIGILAAELITGVQTLRRTPAVDNPCM